MKAVGNLTDFVRHHMLEASDAGGRIETLITHFDDLTRAHDAVRQARDQLAQLEPLIAHCATHDELRREIDEARWTREALRYWMAGHKEALLQSAQDRAQAEIADVDAERVSGGAQSLRAARTNTSRLELAREGAGGSRIAELDAQLIARGARAPGRAA